MPDTPPAPALLIITLASPRGPLASPQHHLPLPPTILTLPPATPTAEPLTPHPPDPLRDAATALQAPATLSLTPTPATPHSFTLAGTLPARPGRYATTLRFTPATAGAPLAVPVQINIGATHAWGIGLMLAGLLATGLLGLLSGQTEVAAAWRDALQARQDMHNLLAANPPPLALAPQRATMEDEYTQAIALLGARPPVSITDHRIAGATPHLQAAQAAAATLRTALAGQPTGAAEVAELAAQWDAVRPIVETLRTPPPAQPLPPNPTLADRLDASLRDYRTRIVTSPANTLSDSMQAALSRARLELAAGNGTLAAALARNQATQLRRAAAQLDTAITGARGWLTEAGAMVAADRTVRQTLARDTLPPDAAATITAHLDQAATLLATRPWPMGFGDASREINRARTALTTAESRAALATFNNKLAASNNATSYADIEALTATLQTIQHPTEAQKRIGLAQILALWRAHVAGVDNAATRARLNAQLDALNGIVIRGKLTDIGPPYRALTEAWLQWDITLMHRDVAQADLPICRIALADLQRDLARMTITLQEDPTLDPAFTLDRARDALDRDIRNLGSFDADLAPTAATSPDDGAPDCLAQLRPVQDAASALSARVLGLQLANAKVADAARIQFAQEAGLKGANATAPRLLLLTPATQAEDIVAGSQTEFTLAQADPDWGSSVTLTILFGDGATQTMDAEAWRQGRAPIRHRYTRPGPIDIAAIARRPNAIEPAGLGHNTITVLRSQITTLQALTDLLTNVHFAFALILALIVYYWRFRDHTATFGARGFDYVEAFALGFAASAATATIPAIMAKLAEF